MVDKHLSEFLSNVFSEKYSRPVMAGDTVSLRTGDQVELNGVKTPVDYSCLYYYSEGKGWELITHSPTTVHYTYRTPSGIEMTGEAKIADLIQHYIGGFGTVKQYIVTY